MTFADNAFNLLSWVGVRVLMEQCCSNSTDCSYSV